MENLNGNESSNENENESPKVGAKKKTAIDAHRSGTTYREKPEDPRFILVKDPASPYYDHRVELEINPEFMLSVFRDGQKSPGTVVKDGPNWIIKDGRQRITCLRYGNKLIREGHEMMAFRNGVEASFWFVVEKAEDAKETIRSTFAANLHNDDPPTMRAKRVAHALKFGVTKEEIQGLYGFKTVQSVNNILDLLDCSEDLQKSVDTGEVSQELARHMAKDLTRAEQDTAIVEMRANGTIKGSAGAAALNNIKQGRPVAPGTKAKKKLSRTFVLKFLGELENVTGKTATTVKAVILTLLGEKGALPEEEYPDYNAAFKRASKK